MGYSRNLITLERFRQYLINVEQGLNDSWEVGVGQADYFAYKVREALSIAILYEDKYPKLAAMARSSKVVVLGSTTVALEPAGSLIGRTAGKGKQAIKVKAAASPPAVISHGTAAVDIVAAWQDNHEAMQQLYFASAKLSNDELVKLYKFLQSQSPAWHMLVDVDGALTLRPPDPNLEGLDWTPEDVL